MKKALLYDKNDYFLFYPNASCTSIINTSDLWPRMLEFVTRGLIHVAVNIPEDFLMNNEGQNLLLQHLVIWKLCILCAQVDFKLTGAPQPSWRGQCWRGRCTRTTVWLAWTWTSTGRLPTSSPRPLRTEASLSSAHYGLARVDYILFNSDRSYWSHHEHTQRLFL